MARRRFCDACGKRTTLEGQCRDCRIGRDGSAAQRPERGCASGCGYRTTAKTGVCRSCTRAQATEEAQPGYGDGIPPNLRPVVVKGIIRWVA